MFLRPVNARSSRKERGCERNYTKNGDRQRPASFARQPLSTLHRSSFRSILCQCWPGSLLSVHVGTAIAGSIANFGNEAIAPTWNRHDIAV